MTTKINTTQPVTVYEKSKQFWTTSIDIANNFGKRHQHVVASIEKLIQVLQKDDPYFRPIFSTDSYGRELCSDFNAL